MRSFKADCQLTAISNHTNADQHVASRAAKNDLMTTCQHTAAVTTVAVLLLVRWAQVLSPLLLWVSHSAVTTAAPPW